MAEKTRNGTLSDAINAVSTMDIIESFGVPNKTRRGRVYILCPGHDDHNFGSCYVDKNDNGYYCYVCGEQVTKWNMVLKLNGNRKADACEWFFKMSGITPSSEYVEDPYKKATQLVKRIELYVNNDKIYNDVCACEKSESSYGRSINGEYLYSELSIASPLLDLYKRDKTLFKLFVIKKLNDVENRFVNLIKSYDKNKDDCFYVENVGLIPNSDLEEACQNNLMMIRDLKNEVDVL